jgi:hypothetical protein
MRITEYGSAQFDHLPGAGIEIINGEEQLKVGFRIATMGCRSAGSASQPRRPCRPG